MARLGVACPVPVRSCNGSLLQAGVGAGRVKVHGDYLQVRRCQSKYLLSEGYERIGSRTFRPPPGSKYPGILILDKRPGMPVLSGKHGEGSTGRPMVFAHEVSVW